MPRATNSSRSVYITLAAVVFVLFLLHSWSTAPVPDNIVGPSSPSGGPAGGPAGGGPTVPESHVERDIPPPPPPPPTRSPHPSPHPPSPPGTPSGLDYKISYEPSPLCYKNQPVVYGNCMVYADIVEFMKSGTSAVWSLLKSHPEISGLNYHYGFWPYDMEQAKGRTLTDYMAKAPNLLNRKKVLLDKGQPGLRNQVMMDRIKFVAPNLLMLFAVRNPVDRLYSHYWFQCIPPTGIHHVKGEVCEMTFREYVRRQKFALFKCYNTEDKSYYDCFANDTRFRTKNHPVFRSLYGDLVRLYKKNFDSKQMHFFKVEKLRTNLQEEMDKIISWMDLTPHKFSPPTHLNHYDYPKMLPDLREELQHLYAGQLRQLEKLTGLDYTDYYDYWSADYDVDYWDKYSTQAENEINDEGWEKGFEWGDVLNTDRLKD